MKKIIFLLLGVLVFSLSQAGMTEAQQRSDSGFTRVQELDGVVTKFQVTDLGFIVTVVNVLPSGIPSGLCSEWFIPDPFIGNFYIGQKRNFLFPDSGWVWRRFYVEERR